MCLAMCLKKQEFQADCVYKLGVYKKKSVYETVQNSGEGEIALMAKIKLHQRVLI